MVASSVFVVAGCAIRKLGSRSGCCIAAAYALSWGLQQLVGFDFHEVAFELPLIACALAAYLDGRWRAAAAWSMPLLLVKEDTGLTVFVLGLLLARRDRRVGIAVSVIAAAVTALAMFVVTPHFAATAHLGRLGSGTDAGGGYGTALAHPWLIPVKLLWPPVKLVTVFMVLAVGGFAAAGSPLILLAVPTLLWRFTANTPNYWGLSWHYSAVLMPVTFLALVDVLSRHPAPQQLRLRLKARVPYLVVILAAILCMAFPLRNLATPSFWHTPRHVMAAETATDAIPSGVLVAATNNLAPHLVDRTTVYPLIGIAAIDGLPQRIDWIAVDTSLPDLQAPNGRVLLSQLETDGFQTISANDGILVLHRP